MAKDKDFPQAFHDFYKTNGYDARVFNDMPSLTRQEFASECDINVIMARYETTGQLPVNRSEPMYLDLTARPNGLMETLRVLDNAHEAFMLLPARVRREFDNDPVSFMTYATDPANLDQMRAWGLAPMPEPEEPPAAPPVVKEPPGGAVPPKAAKPAKAAPEAQQEP